MSAISASLMATTSSIHGLRQQILANAATLYPQEIATSTSWQTFGIVKPKEIFQVIVSGSEQLRASILCGAPNVCVIANGPLASTTEGALYGLLIVTCEALEWYTENLLGTMNNPEECAKGNVDYDMVEGGFHFAAEQRILAEIQSRGQKSE